jgi:serine/threonine-protein kinase
VDKATSASVPVVGKGRWDLVEVLGTGGSSTVWRAHDKELNRVVAVKILGSTGVADPALQRRFHREARHVASLTHPNIVSVYDICMDLDQPFIVMEYVEGQSLRQLLKVSGPLSVAATARIAVDTLSALGHAHKRGIVHRDIKPGNILVTPEGVVKVVDFGVAKSEHETTDLTVLGSFVGTATYASPEQFLGGRVGPESDIYSLGCVLYHAVVGHPPFQSDDVEKLILQHRFAEPLSISEARDDVPQSMVAAIVTALEKDPADRFSNAEGMSQGFVPFVEDCPVGTVIPGLTSDDTINGSGAVARGNIDGLDRTGQHTKTQTEPIEGHPPVPVDRTRGYRRRLWWVLAFGAIAIVGGIIAANRLIGSSHGATSQLPSGRLLSGGFLRPGQHLASPNGHFTLTMQTDGNLVEAANRKTPIWATATSGNFGAYVVMQSDGDLVVYPRGRSAPAPGQPTPALWSSGTFGHPGSHLELSNGGNLMVVAPNSQRPIWEVSGPPT